MVKALELRRGGEGRLNKILKSQLREVQKEQGYQVNPQYCRVVDYVDREHLSDINLNWYLDSEAKEAFEEDILSWDLDTEDEAEFAKKMMIRYHKHKCVVGDFSLGDWRDMDKATNVLSFPQPDLPDDIDAPQPLGDIIVALETLSREAEAEGKAPAAGEGAATRSAA